MSTINETAVSILLHTTTMLKNEAPTRAITTKIENILLNAMEDMKVETVKTNLKKLGADETTSYHEFTKNAQKQFLIQKLAQNNGNRAKTAEMLNIQRSHLYNLMTAYNIK